MTKATHVDPNWDFLLVIQMFAAVFPGGHRVQVACPMYFCLIPVPFSDREGKSLHEAADKNHFMRLPARIIISHGDL